jgi:hypothetical protein
MKNEDFPRTPIVLAVITGVLLVASGARADVWDVGPAFGSSFLDDNFLVDTPNLLVHGTVQVHDLAALQTTETCAVAPCPDRDWYVVLTPPYSSHEVVIDAVSPRASWEVVGPAATMAPPSLSRHDWGGGLLQEAETIGQVVPSASESLRWETVAGSLPADYVAVAQVRPPACGSQCDATAQYTIRFYETTVVVPRFNNSGSQTTVLILQNTVAGTPGENSISGNVNFFVGGPGSLPIQVPFTLLESQGYVLNTSTVAGLAGAAGRITISHNGRYGQLAGKATALEPATGFTFDTPLVTMPH